MFIVLLAMINAVVDFKNFIPTKPSVYITLLDKDHVARYNTYDGFNHFEGSFPCMQVFY